MDGVRAFLTVSTVTIHQLATQYLRRKFTDALDHAGVKAFNAIGAVVAFQAVQRGVAQGVQIFAGIFMAALDLDNQRGFAVHCLQKLTEQRGVLGAAFQRHLAYLVIGVIPHPAFGAGHAGQGIIMEHQQLTVAAELHIHLHAVSVLHGGGKGGQAVFRRALILAKIAAVGKIAARKGGAQFLAASGGSHQKQHQRAQCRHNNQQNQPEHAINFLFSSGARCKICTGHCIHIVAHCPRACKSWRSKIAVQFA